MFGQKRQCHLRRMLVPVALVAVLASSGLTRGEEGAFKTYDAKTFFETTSVFGASFSHDETKLLITTDASGIFNVYSQAVKGGKPKQLTFSESDATFGVSFFPKDDRFLYRADEGGNELYHLYVRVLDGKTIDLTPGENVRATFRDWAGDFTSFYVSTNERDPKFMDLYRYDIETYEREMIFENTGNYAISDISRDGRWLALMKIRTNADNNIFIFDTENTNAEPKLITRHEGDISFGVAGFTPNSGTLHYLSNEESEFNRVWSFDLDTGERKMVQEADWDIMFSRYSWKGRYRVTGVNADARTEITVLDTKSGKPLRLPKIPRGDITGTSISRSESLLAFYVNGDTSPSNLYVLDLESKYSKAKRLTDTLNPAIDETHLVSSEVVRYSSFDGLQIPALLYRPKEASMENQVPALVWVHGGPGGQSRTGYNANIQYLVNHGYAVLAVNNRGSSGYGKTFFHMDDRKHGEVDLQDCVLARKYLESLTWIDKDLIGILGGSYGGYMVAAALTFEPEAFEVGIDIFGVTNWVRTLKSIPPWWESFRESLYAELGDPAQDEERLQRISPLFHAKNITKPLLVIQGKNDPRVLKVESDELVEIVKSNGVPVVYIVFDDEGHGFKNKANRITAAKAYRDFLDRYLKSQ